MASLASAVAIFEPFLAFVLLSNARFVLFCLISFALRATPEKRVCLRFRLAIYVFSLSLGRVDKYHSFTHLNETYVQASNYYENITINKTDEFFCIGPTWKDTSELDDLPEDANFSNMFDMKLFHCINPCDGKTPCIRYSMNL